MTDPLAGPLDLRAPRVGRRQSQACLGQVSLGYRYVVERWERGTAELFVHRGEEQNWRLKGQVRNRLIWVPTLPLGTK